MKIFIPHTSYPVKNKKELFILTRPFFSKEKWLNDDVEKQKWKLDNSYTLVSNIAEADIVLLSFSINNYFDWKLGKELKSISDECNKYNKNAFGYISGDFGIAFPEFSNITYLRMGGFRSQLSQKNKGFPVTYSDYFQILFQQENPKPHSKPELPIVGFCGHATLSNVKRAKEMIKCLLENGKRFISNPFRKDWESLFASAYERARLLTCLSNSDLVKTNFIFRSHYRAGAQTEQERHQTTLEYYNNIAESDYVLCVRGAGNFSVRFYETLMMGKIPVFVNTDCLLPFEDKINWKNHVVWVEWDNRKNIASIVSNFHAKLTEDDYIGLQIANRKLWKETLSVKNMIDMLIEE